MTETIKEYLGLIIAAVGGLFWLARLEGRVNMASKELGRLERQMQIDREDAKSSRAETHDMLREIRGDIKLILIERGSQGK